MITRTTKYTASDGTEHDSPQAAATHGLAVSILQINGEFTPMQERMAEALALKPEALRDAVNAYFDDLEAHPDVDGPEGIFFDTDLPPYMRDAGTPFRPIDSLRGDYVEPPPPSGLELTEKALKYTGSSTGHSVEDWLVMGWTRQQLLDQGMAVEVTGTVGKPLDPAHMEVTLSNHKSGVFGGGFVSWSEPPQGDPDDPTTWRADLPVDHPNYCRPFGTRED